jgi:hypothetical protein
MSTVAELKKKFQSTNAKVALTPEQHAAALRQVRWTRPSAH